MKEILYLLLFAPLLTTGQTDSQNYVKTLTYKEETDTSNPNKAHATVMYYDGLGRPVQKVVGKMATTGKDIITHITYDGFGRQTKEFLPYPSSASDLSYQGNADIDVLTYYGSTSSTPGLGPQEATINPYSEKFFEPSPLNRVLKQAAPGNAWAGNQGNDNDHTIKYAYMANSDSDAILMLRAQAGPSINLNTLSYDISLVYNNQTYPANQLYKNVVKTENEALPLTISSSKNFNLSIEYTNKEGQLVAKQQDYFTEDNFGMPVYGTMYTYYVYDQFGNLTYVVPPGVGTNFTEAVLSGLCYRYKYDSRNRMVEKQIPDKQWEYIVYDALDRPIFTGPSLTPFGGSTSNSTNQGWMITVYDAFGRVAITGWVQGNVTATTRKTQQLAYGGTNVLTAVKGSSTIDGVPTGYTITGPGLPSGFKILSVNYYDDYTWPEAPLLPSAVEGQKIRINTTGLPTGSWTRVLSSPTSVLDNEVSYILYDTRGRAIRNYIKNYLGGYNQVDTKLNFTGEPITKVIRHKRSSATTDQTITINETFVYDSQDRIVSHGHNINGTTGQILSSNTYNELGQLITKRLGAYKPTLNAPSIPLQTVDYKYNIRGWLTDVNDVNSLGNDLFAFRIAYNNVNNDPLGVTVQGLYNGNISETFWRTKTDDVLRKYSYRYDNLNRLLKSYYQKPGNTVTHPGSYNEEVTYDQRGNIRKLVRTGGLDDVDTAIEIDKLFYTYQATSNRLEKVNDESGSPQGFKDVQTSSGIEYTYDGNGNMITDLNKAIAQIKYNHLNLPTEITYTGSTNKITYLYNAFGKKVKKTVTEGNNILEVNYLEAFQYKGGALQFFPHSEGYVDVTRSGSLEVNYYNYVFQYKDHLGNVRASFGTTGKISAQSVKILEENHYYPFGLKHSNYNMDYLQYQKIEDDIELYPPINATGKLPNNYKYNGKELQDELGLNMYDYGARNYDPALGRWMNIDPKAETSRRFSPYVYALNNPVYFIDPDGMQVDDWYMNNKTKSLEWHSGTGQREGYTNLGSERTVDYNNMSYKLNSDGSFIEYNCSDPNNTGTTYSSGSSTMIPNTEIVISSIDFNFSIKDGISLWGTDRSGDVDGLKGTTKESVESSEIPGIGGGAKNPREPSAFGKLVTFFRNLLYGASNGGTTAGVPGRVDTINTTINSIGEDAKDKKPAVDSVTTTYYGTDGKPYKQERRAKRDDE